MICLLLIIATWLIIGTFRITGARLCRSCATSARRDESRRAPNNRASVSVNYFGTGAVQPDRSISSSVEILEQHTKAECLLKFSKRCYHSRDMGVYIEQCRHCLLQQQRGELSVVFWRSSGVVAVAFFNCRYGYTTLHTLHRLRKKNGKRSTRP